MEPNGENRDKGPQSSVAVDGAKIRLWREQKRLTQLYVASMVGVTTDTISRWENNRYPTMKRENAERLAGALEVELPDILRDELPVAEEPPIPPAAKKRRIWPWLTALFLAILIVPFGYHRLYPAPVALRFAPHFAAPGEAIPLQVKVTRQAGGQNGFILKEHLPPGWDLITTTPTTAIVESSGSVVKWLIARGTGPVTISYTVRVGKTAVPRSTVRFTGEVIFRPAGINRTRNTNGDESIRIGDFHWADGNGDHRIDDNEIMPAYTLCEEMKGFNLDWKTIEEIWGGKGYRFTPKEGYVVVR